MKTRKLSAVQKYRLSFIVVSSIIALALATSAQGTIIATFADPTAGTTPSTPFFEINFNTNWIYGGWDDTQTGLNLIVMGSTYSDAYFTMTDVKINGVQSWLYGQQTDGGTIKMYKNNDPITATPLATITFDHAWVNLNSFGGTELQLGSGEDNVVIDCPTAGPITDESFAFSFTSRQNISGNPNDPSQGFTATASFTSSATLVPEPATMIMLIAGSIVSLRRRIKK